MKIVIVSLCLALALSACGGDGQRTAEPSAPSPTAPTGGNQPPPPTDTPTVEPTLARVTRPTPTTAGPLEFQVYVAGCRRAPTAEKPGNVVITISVEATGGNGVYRYVHAGAEEPDKFIDINWEQGTRLSGKVTVISGDGQTLEKEYDFATTDLECTG